MSGLTLAVGLYLAGMVLTSALMVASARARPDRLDDLRAQAPDAVVGIVLASVTFVVLVVWPVSLVLTWRRRRR